MLLAIETSCDETAVAVLDLSPALRNSSEYLKADIISSQTKLHEPFGGVVPELAAREHNQNLPVLVSSALRDSIISVKDISLVAVTRGPGLKGCLLSGLAFAKAFAGAKGVPLLALHHLEGHIFASHLMPEDEQPVYPCLSLIVSGGHTMLVYIPCFREYRIVAQTRDDAAGEAFDKVATLLGLPYPGGPALSAAAAAGNPQCFRFPVAIPQDPASFSFSGLKTAVQRTVTQLKNSQSNKAAERQVLDKELVANLAASLEAAIVRALVEKSLVAVQELKPRSFLLTGGVAANKVLRARFAEVLAPLEVRFSVPKQRWCTDNAAMMGVLAREIVLHDPSPYAAWREGARASGMLGPGVRSAVSAMPKWPLDQLFHSI